MPDFAMMPDFAKMAEFSHKHVTSAETCGQPRFLFANLGAPTTIPEGSAPVTLSAENYMVEPWVRMYQNYYSDVDGDWGLDPGITVTMDWRNQWTGNSVTTKNPVDDYDRFTKLDGWAGECHVSGQGFTNCMSSFAWCGPTNAHLVFYDGEEYASGNTANQYIAGNGNAVDHSFKDQAFNDEAGSVEMLWCKSADFDEHYGDDERPLCPGGEWHPWNIDSAYVWTKDGESELEPAGSPDRKLFYPGSGGSSTTITMTFMGEHVVSTTITVINVPPTVSYLDLSAPPYAEGDEVTVGGEWSDPGAQQVTLTVDWGDGLTEEMVSEHEDGQTGPFSAPFSFSHVYADNGIYSIQVCADDGVDVSCKVVEITVNNVPPSVDAGQGQVIYEGDILALDPATFTDPGTLDTHMAEIDWGDGSPKEPGAVAQSSGSGSVSGSHDYADNGIYTIEVCVKDDDMSDYVPESCDSLNVTVVHGFLRFCAYADDGETKIEKEGLVDCPLVPSGVPGDPDDQQPSGVGSRGKVDINEHVTIQGVLTSLTDKISVDKESSVFGALTAGYDVTVDEGTGIHDSITSGHKVDVKKEARVEGDITAADKVKVDRNATVTGDIFEFASVPPIPDITWVEFLVEAGDENVTVEKGDSLTLPPGVYKDVKVKEQATLILSGQDTYSQYVFKKFEMEKDAIHQLDLQNGPIVIDVAEKLTFGDRVQMQIIPVTGASDILFRVAKGHVELKKEGVYFGTFLARDGDVKLGEGATLTGALYGQKVEVKKEAHIVGMPARDLFAMLFVNP